MSAIVVKKPIKESTTPKGNGRIRLADFIEQNTKSIISEWETFARTLTPAADGMTPLALRDHIPQILAFIVKDIKTPQTRIEQIQKSKGDKVRDPAATVAETHAALRLTGGFDIDQMVSEWRALRASVIKLWTDSEAPISQQDLTDLTRFNEAVDQELAESVSHYTEKVNYSKDLFIGILSHELRNPLNVITMSAHLLSKLPSMEEQKAKERLSLLTKQIDESSLRATRIINDLLDITRARFGSGLPVIKAPMDMGFASEQIVKEMRAAHPTRKIVLETSGDLQGQWDQARIGQVFVNLIGNAIQYGLENSNIDVSVKGTSKEVLLSVHNNGKPIPKEKINSIFESLTRAVTDEGEHPEGINLGLGLYITKEIVVAHEGSIDVRSSEANGTTFSIKLPK